MAKFTFNVSQRTAISAVLKAKKSEDIDVLLSHRDMAKQFELTAAEKEKIQWMEVPGVSARYKDEKDGEEFRLDVEFDVDQPTIRAIISQTKQFASEKKIGAANDDILSVYELLTAPAVEK